MPDRILYERGDYYIIQAPKAFEVYRNGITHATRCATIGLSLGLDRAITEVLRRIAKERPEWDHGAGWEYGNLSAND